MNIKSLSYYNSVKAFCEQNRYYTCVIEILETKEQLEAVGMAIENGALEWDRGTEYYDSEEECISSHVEAILNDLGFEAGFHY